MNSWKVILATMVIFGTGVVTGGLLVGKLTPKPPAPEPEAHAANHATNKTSMHFQPLSPTGLKLELLRRVERELNLQPDQKEQVDRILAQSQLRTRRLMEPVMPSLRAELKTTVSEFRAILSPDQQALFDEMLKQQRGHERRPGGPLRGSLPPGATYPPLSNEPATKP